MLTSAGLFAARARAGDLVWTPPFWIVNDFRTYRFRPFDSHDSLSSMYCSVRQEADDYFPEWSSVREDLNHTGSMLCFPITGLGKHPTGNIALG